ncbi:HNH endonuclease [Promicromonospora panici]|uniref:HNH endonuclease n=1 Tax=Promicromonospora panici TaxID=2219658 RepID=UPI0013E9B057
MPSTPRARATWSGRAAGSGSSSTGSQTCCARDQGICRTAWCDAPIGHLDHVTPAGRGGETTLANGQGLCAACNQAKEAAGWTSRSGTDPGTGRHAVITTTPTGQEYRSVAPEPPRPARTALRPDGPRPASTTVQRSDAQSGPGALSCRVRPPVRHHLRPVARAA